MDVPLCSRGLSSRSSPGATPVRVRIPGATDRSSTCRLALDATDFAFELLQTEDPDALEIVKVDGVERGTAWSYERPADEAPSPVAGSS